MLEAGVTANGGSEKELGSVMKMTILSDGVTPVRRSKRNADVADVGSLEKGEKGSLSRILRNHKVIYMLNRFVLFLMFVLRKT
jgi:hypothetical protein